MSATEQSTQAPVWLWATAGFGVLWNVYGVYQFMGSLSKTAEDSMRAGMTQAQAQLYSSLPPWITVAFAVGVFGGLAGSVALLARRHIARTILAVSFGAYALLFGGDLYYGVFAGIPSQLAILTFVVAVAGGLLWTARSARQRAMLT
jgi:hypothetical protein